MIMVANNDVAQMLYYKSMHSLHSMLCAYVASTTGHFYNNGGQGASGLTQVEPFHSKL